MESTTKQGFCELIRSKWTEKIVRPLKNKFRKDEKIEFYQTIIMPFCGNEACTLMDTITCNGDEILCSVERYKILGRKINADIRKEFDIFKLFTDVHNTEISGKLI